jgi:hypothetical protein
LNAGAESHGEEINVPARADAFERHELDAVSGLGIVEGDAIRMERERMALGVRLDVDDTLDPGGHDVLRAVVTWESRRIESTALGAHAAPRAGKERFHFSVHGPAELGEIADATLREQLPQALRIYHGRRL